MLKSEVVYMAAWTKWYSDIINKILKAKRWEVILNMQRYWTLSVYMSHNFEIH